MLLECIMYTTYSVLYTLCQVLNEVPTPRHTRNRSDDVEIFIFPWVSGNTPAPVSLVTVSPKTVYGQQQCSCRARHSVSCSYYRVSW